ncbi:ACA11 [Scenedesmus sp. PABB004]|nr:ACA11 [Scenedesmus sp. PABB004]
MDASFGLSPEELLALNSDKDTAALKGKHGGVPGLASALGVDLKAGLDGDGAAARRAAFGANTYRQVPPKSFFRILAEGFKDPVILLLCAAATLSTVLGVAIEEERHERKWIEGIAIWVAIFLVTTVSALNDYQKDLQFRKLNAQKDVIQVKAVRGGATALLNNSDVVVGDLLLLDTGDKVVADGVVVDSFGLVLDEASLTGESDPIKKNDDDPWCRSGTQVSEGSGKILVTAVGEASEWGKTISLVTSSGDEQTPLQEKLSHVAATVGKIGATVAATCFVALLIKWCVVNRGFPLSKINQNGPVQFFLYSVTIIVVAIPEGLPLAVTMALAYSMKKMMADQNFVRVLAACETMGGSTAICSDKTGTLTENRMTVTEGWFAGVALDHAPAADEVPAEARRLLELNFALNSKAFLIEHGADLVEFVGNRTECALLMLGRRWGADYRADRDAHQPDIAQMYQFTSAKKMASVLLRTPEDLLLLNKGAAEWVLQRCDSVLVTRPDGSTAAQPLDDDSRAALGETVVGMASRGLRCICLAVRRLPHDDASRPADFFDDADNLDTGLTAVAIVGIKDPVRAEVPAAVAKCQRAGITVRMVTGDNIHTARHIARECGILTDGGLALEGPTFRAMPIVELLPMLPKLQVLARSSPEDKLTLVSLLKHHGEVVAVTGDGTNDAPALKESDVGLAMGIAGTEVAKEAADIVILDDNFSSIVKSVLWGRSVFASIRKFLQFQLTVNFVALVVSFVGALVGGRMPLNVLQLLWVNLIMDTMGALALATETPSPKLLNDKPAGRSEPLINGKMFKHIVAQGFYQLFWMFLFLYGLPAFLPARYALTPACTLYARPGLCDSVATAKAGLSPPDAAAACGAVLGCGLPCAALGSTCALGAPGTVAADPRAAMCGGAGSCPAYDNYSALSSALGRELAHTHDADFLRLASVLFNTFIFAQIFNLVNSRRINDEYNVFEGLATSRLFLAILGVIVLCQVLIMSFLGMFFKVQQLRYDEWLVTVAIGAGAMLWSLAVRALSRTVGCGCGALGAAVSGRLARMNQVRTKAMAAADRVYSSAEGRELSVAQAVGLARGSAAAQAEAEAAAAEGKKEKKEKRRAERKGRAGTREERTLSGRSDSAGSML